MGGLFLVDTDQFDFENQGGERIDLGAAAVFSVTQFLGDVHHPFGADGHHRQRFRPSFNDLIGTKSRRFRTLVRTVEFRTVDQRSSVMHFHGRGVGWDGTLAYLQDFVLQTARRGFHAVVLGVLCQEFLAGGLVVCIFHQVGFVFDDFRLSVHVGRSAVDADLRLILHGIDETGQDIVFT